MEMILLKPEEITPRYIKHLKDKYNLSWSEMSYYCGYDPRANSLLSAVRQPDRYLTRLMKKKIMRDVAKLEKEKGHIHEVTLNPLIKFIPKRFRISQKMEKCKGHGEYCTAVDRQGFCGEECKQLFKQKGTKQK